jgi:beta-galactosidase
MVTYDRQTRKDAFYFYKANWSPDPVLYITSRRSPAARQHHPDQDLRQHGFVTLKVNGVTIGTINSAARRTKSSQWNNIAIQEGTNLVEVTGTRGARRTPTA